MTFLPFIVVPVVDDHESSTELALPGPIKGSLIPVSSHCLDCRLARTRPRLHLWRKRLAPTPVALTVSRIQADVEQKRTKATKKKAAGTHAGRQVMGVPASRAGLFAGPRDHEVRRADKVKSI